MFSTLCFNFPGVIKLTPNVALKGIATQSSTHVNPAYTWSPFVASHTIDGNFYTDLLSNSGTCSHTKSDAPVWWQVDLLQVYEITKVAITGRKMDSK